jgi:hypothetical protein
MSHCFRRLGGVFPGEEFACYYRKNDTRKLPIYEVLLELSLLPPTVET